MAPSKNSVKQSAKKKRKIEAAMAKAAERDAEAAGAAAESGQVDGSVLTAPKDTFASVEKGAP